MSGDGNDRKTLPGMFYEGVRWKGVSCVSYFWPFVGSQERFEVRRAIGQLTQGLRYANRPHSLMPSGVDDKVDLADVLKFVEAANSISKAANETLHEVVGEAVARGATWKQVGDSLGVQRTAAQKRFGKGIPRRRLDELKDEGLMCASLFHMWVGAISVSNVNSEELDVESTPIEVYLDHALRKATRATFDFDITLRAFIFGQLDEDVYRRDLLRIYESLRRSFHILLEPDSLKAFIKYSKMSERMPWADENSAVYFVQATARLALAFDHFVRLWDVLLNAGDGNDVARQLAYIYHHMLGAQRMLSRPEVREVLERIDQEIEESGNAIYGAGGPDSPADDPEALEILHAFWKNDKAALASLLGVSESAIEDILNLNDFLDFIGPDEDNSNPYE